MAPGMIEVDVRQQHLPHVADAHALALQCRAQARSSDVDGPGSISANAGRAVDDGRRDDPGVTQELEIDVIEARRKGVIMAQAVHFTHSAAPAAPPW